MMIMTNHNQKDDDVHWWWKGLELWYNYTDRYMDAMEVWNTALLDHMTTTTTTTYENDNENDYSIDRLEYEWKKLIFQDSNNNSNNNRTNHSTTATTTTTNDDTTNKCCIDIGTNGTASVSSSTVSSIAKSLSKSISYVRMYIFVAGTCLDANRYQSSRQWLFRVILDYILPSILELLIIRLVSLQQQQDEDDIEEEEEEEREETTMGLASGLLHEYYQLLNKALQEYITTHEEEEQQQRYQRRLNNNDNGECQSSSSSWMIGRRIATLRNSLSSTICSTTIMTYNNNNNNNGESLLLLSLLRPQQQYWNTNNIYQRPPYYIHYPTLLQHPKGLNDDDNDDNNNNNDNDTTMNIYMNTPVLQRQYHPNWCQQLEANVHVIQSELQQLLQSQKSSSSSSLSSSTTTTTTIISPEILDTLPKVGSSNHRTNNAGIHDGDIVQSGGDWREIILFSLHSIVPTNTDNNNNNNNNKELFPRTKQLIQDYCYDDVITLVNTGIGEVIVSVIGPQSTHILPHTASHNIRYTAHLPLLLPSSSLSSSSSSKKANNNNTTVDDEKIKKDATTITTPNCYIRIGEEICTWEIGQMLVFDDSYEHEVINTTNEVRIVLLLRFWHPLLKTDRDRDNAIQSIQNMIHIDQIQRYNPPLPPSIMNHNSTKQNETATRNRIQRRCLEETYCSYCQQTGYTSIRVKDQTLMCGCGQSI